MDRGSSQNILLKLFCLLVLSTLVFAKPVTHVRDVIQHNAGLVNALSHAPLPPDGLASRLATVKRDDYHTFNKRNGTGTWTVQAGDTGNGIAVRLSISFAQLESLNPTVQWENLQIGQVLNIPCSDGSTGSTMYVVVDGDTGNSIAAAYGINFDQLSSFNPGVDWYNLQIGQTLLIPRATTPLSGGSGLSDVDSPNQDADASLWVSATMNVSSGKTQDPETSSATPSEDDSATITAISPVPAASNTDIINLANTN